MSTAFKIDFDMAQMAEVKRVLAEVKNGPARVFSRAANKTMTGVRTDATKEIGERLESEIVLYPGFVFHQKRHDQPTFGEDRQQGNSGRVDQFQSRSGRIGRGR